MDFISKSWNISSNFNIYQVSFSMKLRMRNIIIVSKIVDADVIRYTRDLALWLLEQKSSWGYFNMYVGISVSISDSELILLSTNNRLLCF